jgi:hypothetical protein
VAGLLVAAAAMELLAQDAAAPRFGVFAEHQSSRATAASELSLPTIPTASEEKGLFHLPVEGDFRVQAVSKADNEVDWPFASAEGYLTCAFILGQRQVYFVDKAATGDGSEGVLSISNDPFQLAFVNMGKSSLFAPNGGLADLIRRVAPFVQAGQRLCDQPRGTQVGPGEL